MRLLHLHCSYKIFLINLVRRIEKKKSKNTLPDKSGYPKSLKKCLQQFKSFLSNVPIVCNDLFRVFYRLFYLQFCDSSDQQKNTGSKGFTTIFRDNLT